MPSEADMKAPQVFHGTKGDVMVAESSNGSRQIFWMKIAFLEL